MSEKVGNNSFIVCVHLCKRKKKNPVPSEFKDIV